VHCAFDLLELDGRDLRREPIERRKALLAKLLKGSHLSIVLNEHFEEDGAAVYRAACQLGCEGIVSKRLGSSYRSGRSPHWLKVKNPAAPAVKREAEGDDRPRLVLQPSGCRACRSDGLSQRGPNRALERLGPVGVLDDASFETRECVTDTGDSISTRQRSFLGRFEASLLTAAFRRRGESRNKTLVSSCVTPMDRPLAIFISSTNRGGDRRTPSEH
jgi:hypothetical protein